MHQWQSRKHYVTDRHILNETKGEEMLWSFTNSLRFAFSVVTTIGELPKLFLFITNLISGSGDIVPQTIEGRIAHVVFALVGVPLAMIVVCDIGHMTKKACWSVYCSTMQKVR